MLLDAIKKIKLTDKDLEAMEQSMASWPDFQKVAPNMNLEQTIKAFKYEVEVRKRIRRNIFDKLVGMYNRRIGDMNWAQVQRLYADRTDDEAA